MDMGFHAGCCPLPYSHNSIDMNHKSLPFDHGGFQMQVPSLRRTHIVLLGLGRISGTGLSQANMLYLKVFVPRAEP